MRPGLFCVSCSATEEGHKKPGGSVARIADLNWPKGCATPWNVTLTMENQGIWSGGADWSAGWAGHLSAGGVQLLCASLSFLGFYISLSFC